MSLSQQYFIGRNLDPLHKGWVKAIIENEGRIDLPFSTRVKLIESQKNYEKILILEGYYKNSIALLPYLSENEDSSYSYLVSTLKLNKNIEAKLIGNKLTIGSKSWEVSVDYTSLKKGSYSIGFPVKITKKINPDYLLEKKGGSRFAETWFPINAQNEMFVERFIHFGYISEGCVTVKYNSLHLSSNSWNSVFLRLLTGRKTDQSLGTLKVA